MLHTLNIAGRLYTLNSPKCMAIVNLTPDSFFANSRALGDESALRARVQQMVDEGADLLDVGACSMRPDSAPCSEADELARLRWGLPIIMTVVPEEMPISVDTFRPNVARCVVEELGAHLINDVSGGAVSTTGDDSTMYQTVAQLRVPYILTANHDITATAHSADETMNQLLLVLSERVNRLHELGVADIVLDPGFGFGKTRMQNHQILARLDELQEVGLPVLAGLSRKRMIYELLHTTADDALDGTTAANVLALMRGANILRVHDVKACRQAITMYQTIQQYALQTQPLC